MASHCVRQWLEEGAVLDTTGGGVKGTPRSPLPPHEIKKIYLAAIYSGFVNCNAGGGSEP